MAAPWCAGGEDTRKVQDFAVERRKETYQEMVLGSAHSYHTILEPAGGLLQAMRVQDWGKCVYRHEMLS